MGSVLVLGSSNTDLVLCTDELPEAGQTVLGTKFFLTAGGKGANQAVAAARAEAKVSFVGAVADDDFGNAAMEGLRREGINLEFVKHVAGTTSGVAMIMVDRIGRNLIGVAPGANAFLDAEYVQSLPDALFEQADVVVAQLEIPFQAVRIAFSRARQFGATTLLNPAPPDRRILDDQFLSLVDILVLNEPEAALLGGRRMNKRDDWKPLADGFHAMGPATVVLTVGDQGYLMSAAGRRMMARAHEVKAIDTVGAGDTFVGVLAARLAEGSSIDEAARWANAAAALSVTLPGAQPSIPTRAAIQALLDAGN